MRTWLVTGTGKNCGGRGELREICTVATEIVKTRPLEEDYATKKKISATDLIRRGNKTRGAARGGRDYI